MLPILVNQTEVLSFYGYFDLQSKENEKKELRYKITYFRKESSMIGGPIYDFHEYLLFYPAA